MGRLGLLTEQQFAVLRLGLDANRVEADAFVAAKKDN